MHPKEAALLAMAPGRCYNRPTKQQMPAPERAMKALTRILCSAAEGDPSAAAHLLPLVYAELADCDTSHGSSKKSANA
jgi:hypothetical protein